MLTIICKFAMKKVDKFAKLFQTTNKIVSEIIVVVAT